MGLTPSVVHVLRNYVTVTGRAGRSEFWWWYVSIIFVGGAFAAAAWFWGSGTTGDWLVGLYLVFWVAVILPTLAVSVRRLHDSNRSGWWLLLQLVPIFGGIILLVFYVLPSTQGDNTYGPPSTVGA